MTVSRIARAPKKYIEAAMAGIKAIKTLNIIARVVKPEDTWGDEEILYLSVKVPPSKRAFNPHIEIL